MKNDFSKSDKQLLKKMRVSVEPTPRERLAEDRQALVKRIARHAAPAQVKVDPDAAKRQLIRLALEKMLDALGRRDPQALEKLINALEDRGIGGAE